MDARKLLVGRSLRPAEGHPGLGAQSVKSYGRLFDPARRKAPSGLPPASAIQRDHGGVWVPALRPMTKKSAARQHQTQTMVNRPANGAGVV
jgi:hypothetical protein